jgi:hypothetical protein
LAHPDRPVCEFQITGSQGEVASLGAAALSDKAADLAPQPAGALLLVDRVEVVSVLK